MGDGRQFTQRPYEKDTVINGKTRIITGYSTEYIDAEFKDGFPVGKWEYYKDNKIAEVTNYADGYKTGENISYYPDGTVNTKVTFVKGVVDGKVMSYHPNGKVKFEKSWKNGVDDGLERSYNEDGKMWSETNFKNGKAEGKSIQHISGSKMNYTKTSFYKDGLLEGEYSEIFENGKVKEKGSYLKGQKNGRWESNREDGSKKPTEVYSTGELITKITYFPNGSVETERNYKDGKENGLVKKYNTDGTLKSEQNYINGKQVGKQIVNFTSSTGDHYTEMCTYNDKSQKEGDYTEIFTQSKQVKSKGKYVNGQKDGKWVYGYNNGKLYKEETYANGKLVDSKKLD